MKILDDWKVYGGVSDLKQPMEGIPVSQVIINSNYSDDHDDYDIALMKLSRPLTLSGEASQLTWAWLGWCLGDREMGRSERPLGSPWNHGVCGAAASWSIQPCCGHLARPVARKGLAQAAVGSAVPPAPHGARETLLGWAERGAFPAPHAPPWLRGCNDFCPG